MPRFWQTWPASPVADATNLTYLLSQEPVALGMRRPGAAVGWAQVESVSSSTNGDKVADEKKPAVGADLACITEFPQCARNAHTVSAH